MSFAQKILEKYGWKEGDGLGKNNDGIGAPIKVTLKFDNAGLGLDKAEEFNNHWWERVFNEAASNVQVEKNDDKVSVNVKNNKSVEITTKNYSVRKLKKKNKDSYDNFLLSATLTNNGDEVENPNKIEVDEIKLPTYKPLTDEELFAACGGRTAHKGARHGLKLSGKLARIEQQEKEFLSKMQNSVKENSESWTVVKDKKKEKSKKNSEETREPESNKDEEEHSSILYTAEYCIKSKKKRKEKKKTEEELSNCFDSFSMENGKEDAALHGICDSSKAIKKSKKSKKHKKMDSNTDKWEAYREANDKKEDSMKEESEENVTLLVNEGKVADVEYKFKTKKSKKCKHGIDKEAKEAYKKAKKLRKSLQHVTEDLERSVLVGA